MIALYLPGHSILHRAAAGAKLLGLFVLVLGISLAPRENAPLDGLPPGAPPLGVIALFAVPLLVVGAYLLAGLGGRTLLRQLWMARWIIALMVVTQLIFLTPWDAAANTVRVTSIVLLAALLTLTTRSEDLLGALERGLGPLRRVGVDPRRVGLTLSLALGMIPVVAGIARRVREAQQARGVRLGFRAIVPILVLALRHADDVADALSARGVE